MRIREEGDSDGEILCLAASFSAVSVQSCTRVNLNLEFASKDGALAFEFLRLGALD